jgi:hypothetical protein
MILLLLLVLPLGLFAAEGQSGAEAFLDDFPSDVRTLALGNAVASAEAEGACFSGEPVSIPSGDRFSFYSMFARLPFGDAYYYLHAGADWADVAGFRLSWSQVASRNIEKTVVDSATSADTMAYHTIGSMDETENLVSLALGTQVFSGFRIGARGKYYYNLIDDKTGSGFGLDAGLQFSGLPYNCGVSALLRNLVRPVIHYQGLGDDKPASSLRVGLSKQSPDDRWAGYIDFKRVLEKGYAGEWFVGMEFKPLPIVAFRAGYAEFNFNKAGNPCFGAGLLVKGVCLDYAFNGRSGQNWDGGHRIGLGYRLKYD